MGKIPRIVIKKARCPVAVHLPSGKKRKIRYYKSVISTQKRSGGTVVSKFELIRIFFFIEFLKANLFITYGFYHGTVSILENSRLKHPQ
jgi:hypothetical protein